MIADIDECSGQSPCGQGSNCFDSVGSYRCMCPSGFYGDPFTKCIDINECQETPDICPSLATCYNFMNGSYECQCNTGYEGNGTNCQGQFLKHFFLYMVFHVFKIGPML